MNKDFKQFLKFAEKDGWTWRRRKSGHIRLDGPNGEVVFTGGTPTKDRRQLENLQQDMRLETMRKAGP